MGAERWCDDCGDRIPPGVAMTVRDAPTGPFRSCAGCEAKRQTIFSLPVENCCGRWETQRTEQLAVGISRTHIACSGCGQRRILTVTNRPAPHGLEVVA